TANPETIVYEEVNPNTKQDLWILPLSGDRKPRPFLNTPVSEAQGKVSPNGNWIAYCSNESGHSEIYVQPFLKTASGKWQISSDGGTRPRRQKDGKLLFSVTPAGKVMIGKIKSGTSFEFSARQMLFTTPPLVAVPDCTAFSDEYEPSRDGQRFLVRTPVINS